MTNKRQLVVESKKLIAEKMGERFLDAIDAGITADTLLVNFDNALIQIAAFIQATGDISISQAADILESELSSEMGLYRKITFVTLATKPESGEMEFNQ